MRLALDGVRAMNRWTARKNIDNFRKRLEREIDPARRRVLTEMLAHQQKVLDDEVSARSSRGDE
jgi:hypothetical protein